MHSGQKIVIHCAGTLEDGRVFMDTWAGNNPLTVTIGSGQIPPGVERRLMDLSRGQRSVFTLPPSEAYGEYDPSLVFEVPAEAIPNAQDLPVGGFIMVQTDQGQARLKVLAVDGGMVRFDQNHEQAGISFLDTCPSRRRPTSSWRDRDKEKYPFCPGRGEASATRISLPERNSIAFASSSGTYTSYEVYVPDDEGMVS